jgi:predicted PurR-regulated permease PerM
MINLFVILLSYVVIPFFIYFTSTISHQYLKESKQQRDIELKSIHTKLTNQNSSSLHTDVESSINILKDKKDSLQKEHSFYSKLTIEHTFAHLLEFFIIPIFMIIFLMYICGRLLKDLVILLKKE